MNNDKNPNKRKLNTTQSKLAAGLMTLALGLGIGNAVKDGDKEIFINPITNTEQTTSTTTEATTTTLSQDEIRQSGSFSEQGDVVTLQPEGGFTPPAGSDSGIIPPVTETRAPEADVVNPDQL